jgi:nucleoside-specific outer membrane channel protein Tsx
MFTTPTTLLAQAEQWLPWQSANIQLLRGTDYEVGEPQRTIATFEYANRWRYGDLFLFVDWTRFDSGNSTYYGEFSPRFSLSTMTGQNLSNSLIKDVLLSFTYENGKNDVRAYLYGFAIDLDVDGFRFLKTNYYLRTNPKLAEDTWQVTLAWQYPFRVDGMQWLTEGFADIAGNAGPTYQANQYIVPRLLLDIGELMELDKQRLWAGIEYSYWHNKYGIRGVTENNPQIQFKWVF